MVQDNGTSADGSSLPGNDIVISVTDLEPNWSSKKSDTQARQTASYDIYISK